MESLSKKEIEVISRLEFDKKYFFTRKDIESNFRNAQHVSDFIYGLRKKGRIMKINRSRYYLVPIKAKSGSWSEDPFIIADEICESKDYLIGGWSAANYWELIDQMPMQVDIYTTRRQGKKKMMNTRFVFHRTTRKNLKNAVVREISGHEFRIMNKEDTKKWIRSRISP